MRWLVGSVLLLSSLGCGGLFGPPAVLANVRGGPCGTILGDATAGGALPSGVVPLFIDDRAVEPLQFTDGFVSFERPAAPGPHSLTVGDDDLRYPVDVPPYAMAIDWAGWPMPPREGDPVRVDLTIKGQCPREGIRLTAELAGLERMIAKGDALPADGPVRLDLGVLPEGRHTLSLSLDGPAGRIDQRDLRLGIAAPCRDATCADRDNDGVDSIAAGGTDCDDNDPGVFPGATHFPDPDGDGAVARRALDFDCDGTPDEFNGPLDCAEGDPTIPRPEDPLPTGVDEDCDGIVDEGTTAYDDDGDGFSEERGDCNDEDPGVSPTMVEIPDCKDNNCNGQVDDGVQRVAQEDLYEPNDERPYMLQGAQPRRGVFGGHTPTDDTLVLTLRDGSDVESFSLYADDGTGDTFHVTVQLHSAGDGLRYDVVLQGPFGELHEVLGARGQLQFGGQPFKDDSGNYTLRIRPQGETPAHCPLTVQLSSG